SLAPRPRVQPSGVVTVAGGFEGTRPSAGGAAAAPAGSASGSASDEGALATAVMRQTARTAARRTTMAIGLTGDTVRTVGMESRNLLVPQQSCCAFVTDMRYGSGMLGWTGGTRRRGQRFCTHYVCRAPLE